MYIPYPRYPPSSSSIVPPLGVYLPLLPRVVGEAARRRRGWRQEQTEREREAWRKEYGKGGRTEAAKGREEQDETRDKLAGGRIRAGNQATELYGRVGRAHPDGRIGQAPQVTMLFTPWVARDIAT